MAALLQQKQGIFFCIIRVCLYPEAEAFQSLEIKLATWLKALVLVA